MWQLLTFTAEDQISGSQFSTEPLVRRLAIAVEKGDQREVEAAVKAGADVDALGRAGFRLLDWAMARSNPSGFAALLQQGARLDMMYRDSKSVPDPSYNQTILERVLSTDSREFIQAVLRSGVDPNAVPFPQDGRSLLCFAVDAKAIQVIDVLLEQGADVDHRDRGGKTPLFSAMLTRNYKTALHLIDRGADPTVRNHQGHDFVWGLKEWGSRGVRPDQRESFEKIVAELVRRGLLTRQDIVEADKPKQSVLDGPPGITVIEHAPDSEAGQAIRELDQLERDANARDRAERGR